MYGTFPGTTVMLFVETKHNLLIYKHAFCYQFVVKQVETSTFRNICYSIHKPKTIVSETIKLLPVTYLDIPAKLH